MTIEVLLFKVRGPTFSRPLQDSIESSYKSSSTGVKIMFLFLSETDTSGLFFGSSLINCSSNLALCKKYSGGLKLSPPPTPYLGISGGYYSLVLFTLYSTIYCSIIGLYLGVIASKMNIHIIRTTNAIITISK